VRRAWLALAGAAAGACAPSLPGLRADAPDLALAREEARSLAGGPLAGEAPEALRA